ncbi:MAG: hypothetical protein V1781_07660 [Bacteroidota bacterium]
MSNIKLVITLIEAKIKKLVDLHFQYKKELTELKNQNNEFKQNIKQLKQINKDLEEKNKILKLSKLISGTNENTYELKLKINEQVREVDKCIALLNK